MPPPAPTVAKPGPNNPPDPTQIPDGPPEEEFWDRYNKRLEFPLSTVTTVLLHVLVAAFLVLTYSYLMKKEDKGGVPLSLVPDMGGLDDDGSGSAGSGGAGSHPARARSLRWVMRFKTAIGDDYVAQLAAMNAVMLVPLPPDNKDCLYFTNLKSPDGRKKATDYDLRKLGGQIKFSD